MSQTIGPYTMGEKPSPLSYRFLDASGSPINITGFTVKFNYQEHDGAASSADGVISDGLDGRATYVFTGSEFATPGRYRAQFWVGNGTNRYASVTLEFDVAAAVGPVPSI